MAASGTAATATAAAAAAAKRAARAELRRRLAALVPDQVAAESAVVCAALLATRSFRDAGRIAVYLSAPHGEIRTDTIVRAVLAGAPDRACFVPYCDRGASTLPMTTTTTTTTATSTTAAVAATTTTTPMMRMLRVRDADDIARMPRAPWGAAQPATPDDREDALADPARPGLDLIIVPGLGFTRGGDRIGHGRGYYDRFLRECRCRARQLQQRPPIAIGLALRAQLCDALPVTEHDERLDAVLFAPD